MANVRLCAGVVLVTAVILTVSQTATAQEAVPMLVNYQGELRSLATGAPVAGGWYDMVFKIYDVQSAGTALWEGTHSTANGNPVQVEGGIFSVILGSGTGNAPDASLFGEADRWLEIVVGAETLSPRRRITSVAYSLVSENSRLLSGREASQFANSTHAHSGSEITSGTVSEPWIDPLITRDSEILPTVLAGDGPGSTVNADYLDGNDSSAFALSAHTHDGSAIVSGSVANARFSAYGDLGAEGYLDNSAAADLLTRGQGDSRYWALTGNSGTSGANFLGTADNQAVELRVNNARALRLEPNATSPNLIGGYSFNTVTSGVVGAAMAGGGASSHVNRVTDHYGAIGGGLGNLAGDNAGTTWDAIHATVGGGYINAAYAECATIGGGQNNTASGAYATVGGGFANNPSEYCATVSGGQANAASGLYATVGGGQNNRASGPNATVGGGSWNRAEAKFATIAGGGPSDPLLLVTNNVVTDDYGTIGGGGWNRAGDWGTTGDATYATVGGGRQNTASADYATVGGGDQNTAIGNLATVGGGFSNNAASESATVGGGWSNTASADYATVGGGCFNQANAMFATIAGGGSSDLNNYSTTRNRVTDDYGTIGGGGNNRAGDNAGTTTDATYATVGGGVGNTAGAECATVGGGEENTASAEYATVGGGQYNKATDMQATVAGGWNNTASYASATVGGGEWNTASGYKATVPGGDYNTAQGDYSFAAGRRGKANHLGSFVWADSTEADFVSLRNNQFRIRANGGAAFEVNGAWVDIWVTGGKVIRTSTGAYLSTGGAWTDWSNRDGKENFVPVDGEEVLSRLAALPITTWNYKEEEESVRHMGPVAQDFYGAFGLGQDDEHIASLDTAGVALAAIQGLHEMLREKDAEIAEIKKQNSELQERVSALEKLFDKLGQER